VYTYYAYHHYYYIFNVFAELVQILIRKKCASNNYVW